MDRILIVGFALRWQKPCNLLLSRVALSLALQSVRNIAIFVAATTPVLIDGYSEYWKEGSTARGWKLTVPTRGPFAAITAAVLVVITLAPAVHLAGEALPPPQQTLTPSNDPVAAPHWTAPP